MRELLDNSVETQRRFILQVLRERKASTFDFRQMGVASPAPRIKELRDRGYQIDTKLIDSLDHTGRLHKNVALYTLISEPD